MYANSPSTSSRDFFVPVTGQSSICKSAWLRRSVRAIPLSPMLPSGNRYHAIVLSTYEGDVFSFWLTSTPEAKRRPPLLLVRLHSCVSVQSSEGTLPMAAGPKVWTEERIAERFAEGRGQGIGDYIPRVWVQEFVSEASKTSIPSLRLKQTIPHALIPRTRDAHLARVRAVRGLAISPSFKSNCESIVSAPAHLSAAAAPHLPGYQWYVRHIPISPILPGLVQHYVLMVQELETGALYTAWRQGTPRQSRRKPYFSRFNPIEPQGGNVMAAGPKVWDNQQIEQRLAEGRGQGVGNNYIPWVWVQEFSSGANQTRVPSVLLKRTIHTFSYLERAMYLWHEFHGFSDYREQFPMDRRITMGAAQVLEIRHPRYPVSREPTVMMMDALVIKLPVSGKPIVQGWDAKPTYKLRDKRVRAKLSLHRAFCAYLGIEHSVFTEKSVPRNVMKSIEWARGGLQTDDEILPRDNFLDQEAQHLLGWLRARNHGRTIVDVCEDWDKRRRFMPGLSLRLMKILVWRKQVHIDINQHELASAWLPDQRLHFRMEASHGAVLR